MRSEIVNDCVTAGDRFADFSSSGRRAAFCLGAVPVRSSQLVVLGGLGRLLENDDVLPREEFERLLELEALGLDLAAHLLERHLVLGLDRHGFVLAPELHQHEPSPRLEGLEEPLEG